MHKPKSTREIYVESFSVNSANLEKQLGEVGVPSDEIKKFVSEISHFYHERVDAIIEECEKDMMVLESVPSPLKLFIDIIARRSNRLSSSARDVVQLYASAWEDWM